VGQCAFVAGELYLGASGFAYEEWKDGVFYPEGLKAAEMLPFYASKLRSVEINYTFRRTPAEKTLRTWADRTPPEFRFTLKANQRITHIRRLQDPGATAEFLGLARILGERLGTVLFQCPPTLQHDPDVLGSFLDSLPAGTRYAMEFRHPSWEAARPTLEERGVAWCVAETDDRQVGPAALRRRPFAYLRLRKEDFGDEELSAWSVAIRDALNDGTDVYCYFKQEGKGTGPTYALRLNEMLGTGAAATR
jgi:uncharacterized protein YecE (DUF72 family)